MKIFSAISENISIDRLYEIRIRGNMPVSLRYGDKMVYLTQKGYTLNAEKAIIASVGDVNDVIVSATQRSVYAYNDDIIKGFVTVQGGIRIGICGQVVYEGDKIISVKEYSSINIRLPHQILGVADGIFQDVVLSGYSSLIVSPPGAGKTTILRDLARKISTYKNVLIVDERGEIACAINGVPTMDVGNNTDVISGSSKLHAFECAIRSMCPEVIITDEIFGRDIDILIEAQGAGISVIASAHAQDKSTLLRRNFATKMLENKLFNRYYFLSSDYSHKIWLTLNSEFDEVDV